MGAQGTATLDFTTTPSESATATVTGQAGILSTSGIEAWFQADSTADNTTDEHTEAGALCPLICGNIVVGTGFDIVGHPIAGLGIGQFKVQWVWN